MTKKISIVIGVVLVAALAAAPVFAQGPGWWGRGGGWGMSPGMMNGMMMGPGMMGGYGYGPGWTNQNVDPEKAKSFYAAQEKFFRDTEKLRQEIYAKRLELQAMYANPKTSKDDLIAKQREVLALRDQLAEKRLSFRKDIQDKYPELSYGWGRGWHRGGWGMGPGMMMGGWSRGGWGGGPGYCWQ